VVARIGGDEFAILAATLTLQQASGRLAAIVNDSALKNAPVTPDKKASGVNMMIVAADEPDRQKDDAKQAGGHDAVVARPDAG
jgi:GGDEF domain-containing protein